MSKFNLDDQSDDWVNGPIDAIASPITSATLVDNGLHLILDNGTTIDIEDDGQLCCESRYATCDDDLTTLVGAKLVGVRVKEAKITKEDVCETHEVAFLDVITTNGTVTLATHNEHNGYYGGFALRVNITVPGKTIN